MSDYFDRLFRYVSEQTYRHKLTDTLIAILRTPILWGEAISVYGPTGIRSCNCTSSHSVKLGVFFTDEKLFTVQASCPTKSQNDLLYATVATKKRDISTAVSQTRVPISACP